MEYSKTGPERSAFTIMTYNIKVDVPEDEISNWAQRRDSLNAVVEFYNPDIFCAQEALPHQMTDLARMSRYGVAAFGRDDGRQEGEHAAILYRADRYEVQSSGSFWLSQTPGEPSYGWGSRHRRMATWAVLLDRPSGKQLTVVCTHLDHEFVDARINGAAVLLSQIPAIAGDGPVILVGDFNENPDGPGVQAVLREFQDSRIVSELPAIGPDGTFNGFDVTNVAPDDRIDYIFVQGDATVIRQANLVTITPDGRLPSDHFPVFAEIAF